MLILWCVRWVMTSSALVWIVDGRIRPAHSPAFLAFHRPPNRVSISRLVLLLNFYQFYTKEEGAESFLISDCAVASENWD